MPSTTNLALVLIAGPYRSGTGDDPDLIAANRARLEAAADLPGRTHQLQGSGPRLTYRAPARPGGD